MRRHIFLSRLALAAAFIFLGPGAESAQASTNGRPRVPSIFGDNMVLQQGCVPRIWGWAGVGERITVSLGRQKTFAKADASGEWEARLKPLAASSDPVALAIRGSGGELVFTNILVGEVWLCSGQSNMEKPIGAQRNQRPVLNHLQELANADYPQIRLFKVAKNMIPQPMPDTPATGWRPCNSNSLESIKFSAAAYFFGRELHSKLNVPIGLIESAWGGTLIEPWISAEGFAGSATLAGSVTLPTPSQVISNTVPTVLFNAMIAPLAPYPIRGALWYQGEQNCVGRPDPSGYTEKMEALIGGWRKAWELGDFPFYYVQLAPYQYCSGRVNPLAPTPEVLPEMWEAQARARRVPNTGMIVTTDLVDDLQDVHPRNKQDVGKRLALLALHDTYGHQDVVARGPRPVRMEVKGKKAVVTFAEVAGGLASSDGETLRWFVIAGPDGEFLPATASIRGKDEVVVSNPQVARPRAVRLGWHETAQPNLMNSAGLPAEPFRIARP